MLHIEQDLAKALARTPEYTTDGVSLRLSGGGPNYFAITQKGTDASQFFCKNDVRARVPQRKTLSDLLACSTMESSRNPVVQGVLEYLKRTDSD